MAQSGEPTEEPTPKRLDEARRRGQVPFSRDLASAVAMTAAIAALVAGGPAMVAELLAGFRAALTAAPAGGAPGPALVSGLRMFARALLAPLAAAFAAALAVGLLQTRGLVALGALKPDLGRLSPAKGLKRAFGGEAALQVVKGLLKVTLVAAIAWATVRPALAGVTGLTGAGPARLLAALGTLAGRLAGRVALVALGLGVADYLIVLRKHNRGLRMTRDEVKREAKESEGDPSHRAERQRLHRELLEQRMVAEVRKADFVVVNPDHIAVALRYDREGNAAPVVVASGERLIAERIKAVARQAGVPIFRDVTLARSLRDVPEGEEIPVALYEAVAEVLRVVYGMEAPGGAGAADSGAEAAAGGTSQVGPSLGGPGPGWKRA
jgi:flagellar biosynthesis protein FlhB